MGQTVLVHIPSDPLDGLQHPGLIRAPPLFAHVERDPVRLLPCPEDVDVVGDQEEACSRGRCTPLWHELGGAEVRCPLRSDDLLRQTFVLPGPDVLERHPILVAGSGLVEIDGDAQLVRGAVPERSGALDALLHCDATHGHERAHVHGPHPRVRAAVPAHVNPPARRVSRAQRSLDDGVGGPDERVHGSVGRLTGIHVEQRATRRLPNRIRDRLNGLPVSSLGKVGDTLYDLAHHAHPTRVHVAHGHITMRSADTQRHSVSSASLLPLRACRSPLPVPFPVPRSPFPFPISRFALTHLKTKASSSGRR